MTLLKILKICEVYRWCQFRDIRKLSFFCKIMTIKDTQFQMNLFNFDFDSLAAWNYYHCDFYAFKNHVIFKIVKLNWLTVHLNLLGNKIQPFTMYFAKYHRWLVFMELSWISLIKYHILFFNFCVKLLNWI